MQSNVQTNPDLVGREMVHRLTNTRLIVHAIVDGVVYLKGVNPKVPTLDVPERFLFDFYCLAGKELYVHTGEQ